MTAADDLPAAPVVFAEPGARWVTLLGVPVFIAIGLAYDAWWGSGLRWFVWVLAGLVLAVIGSWIVHAAREHTSVELTAEELRQGTESLPVDEIVTVFGPAPKAKRADDLERWQRGRALGEISRVPRGRRPVGLQLRRGSVVQAWARDDVALRAALTDLVEARREQRR